jgi:hypothetical protein
VAIPFTGLLVWTNLEELKMDSDKILEIWEKHEVEDRLYERYCKAIEADWKWEAFQDAELVEDEIEHVRYYSTFLGTVFALLPSGKYWTAWAASNVDLKEQLRDSAYMQALNDVFELHGMVIEAGVGDPCDLFATWGWEDIEEEEEDENA